MHLNRRVNISPKQMLDIFTLFLLTMALHTPSCVGGSMPLLPVFEGDRARDGIPGFLPLGFPTLVVHYQLYIHLKHVIILIIVIHRICICVKTFKYIELSSRLNSYCF
jgi:hypothetical protein